MKDLYVLAGVSKQALHQFRSRKLKIATEGNKIFEQADAIRKQHPGAGCRKMALELRRKGWGRDKTEQWLLKNGYRVQYPPNYTRTTQWNGSYYYPNLIEGLELNNVQQVIQTDITYYRVNERFYYLTFLIDVYSRVIVGYASSKNLEAEANIRALNMMLRYYRNDHKGLIHHSDRGSQYTDKEYISILRKNHIRMSMCTEAWENAYSERINRTIKEEYLDGWLINSYEQLEIRVKQAVNHYNRKRRHQSLKWISPIEFESTLCLLPANKRPILKIYKPE